MDEPKYIFVPADNGATVGFDNVTLAGDELTELTVAPAEMACAGELLDPFNPADCPTLTPLTEAMLKIVAPDAIVVLPV